MYLIFSACIQVFCYNLIMSDKKIIRYSTARFINSRICVCGWRRAKIAKIKRQKRNEKVNRTKRAKEERTKAISTSHKGSFLDYSFNEQCAIFYKPFARFCCWKFIRKYKNEIAFSSSYHSLSEMGAFQVWWKDYLLYFRYILRQH